MSFMSYSYRIYFCAAALALSSLAMAAKPAGAVRCYDAQAPVACFLAAAKAKLPQVTATDERADAIGELLYALAETNSADESVLKEATALAQDSAVKPVKQMSLLYAIDLYSSTLESSSDQSYWTALRKFSELEQQLKGGALIDLYVEACAIISWDDAFRERWLEFAQTVCNPERLQALKPDGVVQQTLVLAMMPVAMTFADNRAGFAVSADRALSWLSAADKLVAKSKGHAERDFVAFIAVLMHTMNALCLDAFEMPDAATNEVDVALQVLRRQEKKVGITGENSALRRQVVESLFNSGREATAKQLLRQILVRLDSPGKGKRIAMAEQVAILALAARLEHDEQADSENHGPGIDGALNV